ncbi:ADP-dependent glucokinase isoform X2 [Condylostylus longicornis]|uniref:ADP-dependent glucokinase isoform X2 n=1 Tax=Condylostylus longicornis TaxID=2530218 RepID=UPI00244E0D08|nr:ADP-dependent glucokinase isoform X2 [Condylostylus longicornis]
MFLKYFSIFTIFSVVSALLSIICQAYFALKHLNTVTTILASLLAIENLGHGGLANPKQKVAVGYGACVDLIVNGTTFLNFSDFAVGNEENFYIDDVTNYKEFIQSFGYYFKNGAAAERFTPDKFFFQNLVNKAKTEHDVKWVLGGNAPVMGIRFLAEGCNVLLGSRMSTKLRKHLPENIQLIGNEVDEDDIHLILEYKANEEWGDLIAPRANRYILHNDKNNPQLSTLEEFGETLKKFKPKLLVVSGLQMMDSYKYESGVREERLEKLRKQISAQPKSTLIHFEMASYVELKLLQLLSENILPYSDSIGMNEQELDNLQKVLSDGQISFASDSNPRVATALDQMRKIFFIINSNYLQNRAKNSNCRMLTRMHVHTLAYQAILTVNDSQWTNNKLGAAKAALTANRYVCDSDRINPDAATLILDESFATSANGIEFDVNMPKRMQLDPKDPVPCWNESMF